MRSDTTRTRDEIPTWAWRISCGALLMFSIYMANDRLTTIDDRLKRIEVVLFIPAIHTTAPLAEK